MEPSFVAGWRAGFLDAFDTRNGELLWRLGLLSAINTSVLQDGDTILVGTLDGFMHRVALATGEHLASIDLGGMSFGDLVRAGDLILVLLRSDDGPYRLTAWTAAFDRVAWAYPPSRNGPPSGPRCRTE
jgi:outer membrane protein assembly factor BamB